ncbi:MAG: class I SAM-dependent methyltransferase [Lachnospiraceae bacterium]|nr:class I SAM-dependent methyltransferase [Lachnospiraceae bacterium]
MTLSDRLETLLKLAGLGRGSSPAPAPDTLFTVADIGCDHGFVSLELIRRGIADRVVAADLREGPLQRAREHVREAGLEEHIDIRISDGFSAVSPGECDACVIAGMGGALMEEILTGGSEAVSRMAFLVLQPQSELMHFRAFLREQGFSLIRGACLKDEGKWYFPMLAVPAGKDAEGKAAGDLRELTELLAGLSDLPGSPEAAALELSDRYGADLLLRRSLADYLSEEAESLDRLRAELEGLHARPEERLREIDQKRKWNALARAVT